MIIQLATSLVFLANAFYGPATTTEIIASDKLFDTQKTVIAQPITLEEHVRDYFKDDPIMAEIAKCESNYRHFGKSGKIIRGKVNPDDVGVMQINEYYHANQAERLGFDIYTLEGNMAYAKWLYEKEGVTPWKSSSKCWDDAYEKLSKEVAYTKKESK